MKLLFDHNLPPLLVSRLADLFPHSQHVFVLGLDRASDWEIREYSHCRKKSGLFKERRTDASNRNGFVLWLSG